MQKWQWATSSFFFFLYILVSLFVLQNTQGAPDTRWGSINGHRCVLGGLRWWWAGQCLLAGGGEGTAWLLCGASGGWAGALGAGAGGPQGCPCVRHRVAPRSPRVGGGSAVILPSLRGHQVGSSLMLCVHGGYCLHTAAVRVRVLSGAARGRRPVACALLSLAPPPRRATGPACMKTADKPRGPGGHRGFRGRGGGGGLLGGLPQSRPLGIHPACCPSEGGVA